MAKRVLLAAAVAVVVLVPGCLSSEPASGGATKVEFAVDETMNRVVVQGGSLPRDAAAAEWDDFALRLASNGDVAVGGAGGSHNRRPVSDGSVRVRPVGAVLVADVGADVNVGDWIEFCGDSTSPPPPILIVESGTGKTVFEARFTTLARCPTSPREAGISEQAKEPVAPAEDAVPGAGAASVALVSLAGLSVIAVTAPRWGWRFLAFLGGFSRLRRDDLLEQRHRQAIHEAVTSDPGARAADIRRRIEMRRTTFFYHVRRLRASRLIELERHGGRIYLFPPQGGRPIPHPLDTGILRIAAQPEGASLGVLASSLNTSASTVHRRLRALEASGLLKRRAEDPRNVRWYVVQTSST